MEWYFCVLRCDDYSYGIAVVEQNKVNSFVVVVVVVVVVVLGSCLVQSIGPLIHSLL